MNPYIKVLLQRPGALMKALSRCLEPGSTNCTSCGSHPLPGHLDRRFGVLTLRRCSKCQLQFRTPTDTPIQSSSFYQEDYTEESVTELPDANELAELKSAGFATKGDLTSYLQLMRRFHGQKPAKLLEGLQHLAVPTGGFYRERG